MPQSSVVVKLVGENGNVFNIIAIVSKGLERGGHKDLAKEFKERAFKSESYDAVLILLHEYVEVE